MSGSTSTDIWIAGAFAAFSVDLLVYPLDTLKTRIQSPEYRQRYVVQGSDSIRTSALFRGLYQGMGSVILATLPSSGAFFTTYEHSKTLFGQLPVPTPVAHSAASAVAECVSCAILTPAEVIKQNAQMVSQTAIDASHKSATRQTIAKFKRNPLALWRGYGALTTRNLPFTALQFPIFERWRSALTKFDEHRRGQRPQHVWERGVTTAVSAGSAGAVSAVITTPIDVVKTRIMLAAAQGFAKQDGRGEISSAIVEGRIADAAETVKEESSRVIAPEGKRGKETAEKSRLIRPEESLQPSHDRQYKMSSLKIARQIIEEQGWKGLWRGGALRGAWTMLGSGLYLGIYESGRAWLEQRRSADDK